MTDTGDDNCTLSSVVFKTDGPSEPLYFSEMNPNSIAVRKVLETVASLLTHI